MQQRFGKRGMLALVVLLAMASPISTDMYMVSLPEMAQDLNTTSSLASLTITVFFIAMACGMILIGPASDKFGRRPVLVACSTIALISCLGCAFTPRIEILIVCRLIHGVSSGGMAAIGTAIIRDSFEGPAVTKALSITQSIAMFAPMVAPLIGVALLKGGGWRLEFIALGVLMGVALGCTLVFSETLPADKRVKGPLADSLLGLTVHLRRASFVKLLIIGGAICAPYMAYLSVASFIYISYFGVSEEGFSLFFMVTSIAAVLGPLTSAKTARVSARITISGVLAATLACAGVLFAVGHDSPLCFLAGIMPFVFVATYSRPTIASTLLADVSTNVGAAASLANFSFAALGCLGMLAMSASQGDYIATLCTIMAVSLAIAVVSWASYLRARVQAR